MDNKEKKSKVEETKVKQPETKYKSPRFVNPVVKKKLEVMDEPPAAKVRKNSARIYPKYEMEGDPLTLMQFRSRIATMQPQNVVPEFRALVEAGMIKNPRACYLELKRLGYSVELEKNGIAIKDEK